MDLGLICLFLHGEELKTELDNRENFVTTNVHPTMEMVRVTFRGHQLPMPEMFTHYSTEEGSFMLNESSILQKEEGGITVTQRDVRFGSTTARAPPTSAQV